ncbi:MAG: nickel pincer cofactor biosynthesis protein LarB [Thermoanaerobacteraceae bacterium]|nr:nickel pincer cofactor biosynthesis protein LarB [Thermoanaerobacteraceae bacterium]
MMDKKELLEMVRDNKISVGEALRQLNGDGYNDLGYAKIDYDRKRRKGYPEVIFCQGKTVEQVRGIIKDMMDHGDDILGTRANKAMYEELKKDFPDLMYNEDGRIIYIKRNHVELVGRILVVTGGTSDIPVAEEAACVAEFFGNKVARLYDVGVAGLHRLIGNMDTLRSARVIIAVAGMEGALPSVVAGLVSCPVIAVPTSVGYGANFHGLSALLAMLNSCASGVAVVNIDNGFGAAYMASIINRMGEKI